MAIKTKQSTIKLVDTLMQNPHFVEAVVKLQMGKLFPNATGTIASLNYLESDTLNKYYPKVKYKSYTEAFQSWVSNWKSYTDGRPFYMMVNQRMVRADHISFATPANHLQVTEGAKTFDHVPIYKSVPLFFSVLEKYALEYGSKYQDVSGIGAAPASPSAAPTRPASPPTRPATRTARPMTPPEWADLTTPKTQNQTQNNSQGTTMQNVKTTLNTTTSSLKSSANLAFEISKGRAALAIVHGVVVNVLPIKWSWLAKMTGKHKKVLNSDYSKLAAACVANTLATHFNAPAIVQSATKAAQNAAVLAVSNKLPIEDTINKVFGELETRLKGTSQLVLRD